MTINFKLIGFHKKKMERERTHENFKISEDEEDMDFENLCEVNLTIFPSPDCSSDCSDSSSDGEVSGKKRKTFELSENGGENLEGIKWGDLTGGEETPDRINFTVSPYVTGPQVPPNVVEPVEFFKLFFTQEIVNEIIEETNECAHKVVSSKKKSKTSIWQTWKDIEPNEFWAFIGVILNMGTIPLGNIQEYWSTKRNSEIPFFSDIFTRVRFTQIFWMLHLKPPNPLTQEAKTGVQKVSSFFEYINNKFSEFLIPEKNLCVEESVVKFKGKICFVTSSSSRPAKLGLRIFVLIDSETGYIYSIIPYYGNIASESLSRPELPMTARVPIHLYQKLLERVPTAQGYHLHTTKHLTSVILANELLKMKCHLTGIIKRNKTNIPTMIKKPDFTEKKTVAYKSENTILLAWKNKRTVALLTNYHNSGITSKKYKRGNSELTFEKPNVVIGYTRAMSGVLRADQYASSYCFLKKSLKWWRKLFFWVLEISVINSYILYKAIKEKKKETPLPHSKFIKTLVDQLVGSFHQERIRSPSSVSAIDSRLDGKLHVMRRGKQRDCIVCSKRNIKGGRHETGEYCDTCPKKPRMHMGDCFVRYHTMENFKI